MYLCTTHLHVSIAIPFKHVTKVADFAFLKVNWVVEIYAEYSNQSHLDESKYHF